MKPLGPKILYLLCFLGFLLVLGLAGEVLRAHVLLFGLLWFSAPVFACFLNLKSIIEVVDLSLLRQFRVWLMILTCFVSLYMLGAGIDEFRNIVGPKIAHDYHHWSDYYDGDDGPYRRDDWTCDSLFARAVIHCLNFSMFVGLLVVPWATFKASTYAIRQKEESVELETRELARRSAPRSVQLLEATLQQSKGKQSNN